VHQVAQLRAAADPAWIDKIFIPYDDLLSRGRVIRDAAAEVRTGAVRLASGRRLDADWVVPATGSAAGFPAGVGATGRDEGFTGQLREDVARQLDGRLPVDEHLRVTGFERVFAIGDVNDTAELKTGRAAGRQGEVAAANIRALIEGGPHTAYEPFPDGIILSLGPDGGAGWSPGFGFLDAAAAAVQGRSPPGSLPGPARRGAVIRWSPR
jgi:NADH dehydrogenase FAD-containing subunit